MKRSIIKSIALILSFAVVLMCTGCFGGKSQDFYSEPVTDSQPVVTLDFSLDTDCIVANTTTPVYASAYIPDAIGRVELWDNAAFVAEMLDDGLDGDEIAGDGIYGLCLEIITDSGNIGETLYFHVQADGRISETLGIEVLGLPTAEESAEAGYVLQELSNIAYSNENDPAFQLKNALDYADALRDEGILKEYYVSDDTIEMVHRTGMHMIFMPYIPNTLAVGDGSEVYVATMDSYSDAPEFLTPLSSFSDGQQVIYANENTLLTANYIANSLPNFYYEDSADLDVSEVTPENIVSLIGPNMLILWQGHGGHSNNRGGMLGTGAVYDEYRYATDPDYYGKFLSDQYVTFMDGRVAITPKFIRSNVGDLSGSVIFLNACLSGYDNRLANAFLSKGAQIVAAYSRSVYVPYASAMQYTVLTRMAQLNKSTGDYYTMQEALDLACYNYGYTDLDCYPSQPGKVAAKVVTFGADPANVRFATVRGSSQDSAPPVGPSLATPPPAVTPEPTPEPPRYTNSDAHAAYKQMLIDYAWIGYVPSDLSEIPPTDYEEFYLGSYYVVDIDDNGIDELIIKCGQSIADMSMTVFTYADGSILRAGYVETGDSWLMEITNGTGAIVVEHHGGMGVDTYIDLIGTNLITNYVEEYNYEQPGYVDSKEKIGYYPNSYSVHDLSGLR